MAKSFENGKNPGKNWNKNKRGSKSYGKGANPKNTQDDLAAVNGRNAAASELNHPEWYSSNPQLMKDAARLAFSNMLGLPAEETLLTEVSKVAGDAVPGIFAIDFTTIPGVSDNAASPVNVAAQSLYSFVRHANSGAKNYDPQDLMMYILAADSMYTAWATLVRAYGVMNTYSITNRYLAQALFETMGLDFNDFIGRAADFRAFINLTAVKMSKLCVPKEFSFFKRHLWMASHMWCDAPVDKAQIYMYVPSSFWKYSEMTSDAGAELLPMPWLQTSGLLDFDSVVDFINSMIDPLIASEDIGIMSGDIRKAFGLEHCVTLTNVPDGYVVLAEYGEDVVKQIQNSICVTGELTDANGNPLHIKADANTLAIKCEPYINPSLPTSFQAWEMPNLVLNLRTNDATPEDVMVATRLAAFYGEYKINGTGTIKTRKVLTAGTELVVGMRIMFYNYNDGGRGVRTDRVDTVMLTSAVAGTTAIARLSQFDWHPFVYLAADDGGSYTFCGIMGDFDNYTFYNAAMLKRMNEVAVISEFDNPSMGIFLK